MSDDARYHETRAAREMAIASSCTDRGARQCHMDLAERHAQIARALRESAERKPASGANAGLSAAIDQSRELLAQSRHILAESRRKVRASDGSDPAA